MKKRYKILIIVSLLLIAVGLIGQTYYPFWKIGTTIIKDSANYTTFNHDIRANGITLGAGGGGSIDTSLYARLLTGTTETFAGKVIFSDNMTANGLLISTGNNFIQNGTYFTDSVNITGAILKVDSVRLMSKIFIGTSLSQIFSSSNVLTFVETGYDWQTGSNSVMTLDSASGLDLYYGNYTGDGSGLTLLNASELASGTIPNARLGTGSTSLATLGTVTTGTWNGSVVTGQYGGTGVANTGKSITLGGNFTTSGAHATTFTTTGTTGLTLPTTGTLSTLAGTEAFTGKTIDGGSNTITGIQRGMLYLQGTSLNPVNGTSYYIGSFTSTPSTTEANRRFYIPSACTIDAVTIFAQTSTASTGGQTATINIRVDGVQAAVIGVHGFATTAFSQVTGTGLGVNITGGGTHYFTIEIVCPTWTLAPTGVLLHAAIQFKY